MQLFLFACLCALVAVLPPLIAFRRRSAHVVPIAVANVALLGWLAIILVNYNAHGRYAFMPFGRDFVVFWPEIAGSVWILLAVWSATVVWAFIPIAAVRQDPSSTG